MADCPSELQHLTKIRKLNLKRKASSSIMSPGKSKRFRLDDDSGGERPPLTPMFGSPGEQKKIRPDDDYSERSFVLPPYKEKTGYAPSVLSLAPSMAYGTANVYDDSDMDDDLLSSPEGDTCENLIELNTSLLNRENGVLFSEDLTDDYEIWTCQCPDDINIIDLQDTFLQFNDLFTAKLKNNMSHKVDVIPLRNQEDTNIAIVIPSEKTKQLSLNMVPLTGSLVMSNRVHKEKSSNKTILPIDTIDNATRHRSELMSKIIQRLSNKGENINIIHSNISIKKEIKIENESPKKVKKSSKRKLYS